MLDPRIYRTGLGVVALAVIVFAFSLYDQQGPLGTTLAPDAFDGQNAYTTMNSLASSYPVRRPGSPADYDAALEVARQFTANGVKSVATSTFSGRTVDGTRTLETVTATLPGLSSGTILVVAHRDSLGAPATAELSGTATLIELSRALAGETLQRTIVLASISGSAGAAGARQLAGSLTGPVDAVIVLGDLAGSQVRQPVVVPWSDSQNVASPRLRNTLASALGAQATLPVAGTSLAGQFVHLALPLSLGEQAPFDALGAPAVLLSLSGDRPPAPDEAINGAGRITALGRTVLQAINALETGLSIPAPSAYVLLAGKVVPAWAIQLLVLALIVPVLMATIDAVARARRRGHQIARWLLWVLASAMPFVLAALFVVGLQRVGMIKVAPPGPVGAGAVPLHATGVAILIATGCVLVLSFALLRPLAIRLAGGEPYAKRRFGQPANPGAGAAVLLLLCLVSLVTAAGNPFAAALIVPALHLWMWVLDPQVRLRTAPAAALLLVGLAPAVLVVVYYAIALGLGPVGVAWNGILLLAGGHVGILAAVQWSVLLGCTFSACAIALRRARAERPKEAPVTVRGPITYAGPGSLGGTESALRR